MYRYDITLKEINITYSFNMVLLEFIWHKHACLIIKFTIFLNLFFFKYYKNTVQVHAAMIKFVIIEWRMICRQGLKGKDWCQLSTFTLKCVKICQKYYTKYTAIPASYINSHSQHADCCAQVYTLGILRSEKDIFISHLRPK